MEWPWGVVGYPQNEERTKPTGVGGGPAKQRWSSLWSRLGLLGRRSRRTGRGDVASGESPFNLGNLICRGERERKQIV